MRPRIGPNSVTLQLTLVVWCMSVRMAIISSGKIWGDAVKLHARKFGEGLGELICMSTWIDNLILVLLII